MRLFNCIIVEDEPLAAEVLHDYINDIPFLNYIGCCSDAIYAMEMLQKQKVDLMFLDIHLPKVKGLDFIKTLQHPPHIIITTAYHEYALQGYEYNVVDYLLKPVEFNRFLMAVNKLKSTRSSEVNHINSVNSERPYLFFNVGKKKVKVYQDEILYIESLKEYIRIYTTTRSIITKYQMNEIETLLIKGNFLRVHRSYLVAKSRIDAFTATDVEVNGKLVPVGRSYKELVQTILEGRSVL
jgi:DNA-binding LytR/AlgR family response regulator